jgi:hypothetical protein
MKYSSTKQIPVIFILALGLVYLSSCTKKFKEYNTDPTGISNQQLAVDYQNLGAPLEQAQLNIYAGNPAWVYQLQQNLIADVYSGYMMSPDPFQGGVNNTNYFLVDGWNFYPWDYAYNNVMNNIKSVLDQTSDPKYASYHQWAKIIRVEAMHRVSDIYGPIIYSHYGTTNPDRSVTYDSQKDAYYEFFNDLDTAITTFTGLVQSGAPATFGSYDLAYGGSFTKWLKFANTLRLRLALRISKVDPAKAQAEGEKALANPIGLLTTNDDNCFIDLGPVDHPLDVINNSWGDIRLGAPVGSILNGYSDPRISKYASKASDPAVAGQYIGIRNGINIDAIGRYENYSSVIMAYPGPDNTAPNPSATAKVQIMVAAEAWFLKAEAAIRGWAGAGDAATNYNTGIETSFGQYGLDASTYENDAISKPAQYIDPNSIVAGQNNITTGSPWLSTITIKWDGAASFDKMLERIITQKWIAMYPEGQEAWSEFRRTGYPKLFPVVVNNSGGTISTTNFIRRINFPSDERANNPAGVASAVQVLGGPDNGGTRLWWDIP